MQNKYEVTIIGAGPAGAIAGYELTRKGVKTLIIEAVNKILI